MNRERLLFAGVLGLIALWFFVIREPAKFSPPVSPGQQKHTILPVRPLESDRILLEVPYPYGAFTRVTNERRHARPQLPLVVARDLPNIAVPTSRNVRISSLGTLRHNTVAPDTGEATLTLPTLDAAVAGGGAAAPAQAERADQWTALGNPQDGKVVRIRFNRKWIRDPGATPKVGKLPTDDFHRLLIWCEMDPVSAETAGVTEIEVELKVGGQVRYPFPREINGVKVGTEGTSVPYLEGLRGYLRAGKTAAARAKSAEALSKAGLAAGGIDPRLEWALVLFDEARAIANPQNKGQVEQILKGELAVATALFRHELVLELAFEHLSKYPGNADVIEIVGTLLSSRTFGLLGQAELWFAQAPQSTSAQLKRVGVLIQLDRFDEARRILEDGRAGAGPMVSLSLARAALAQSDFALAVTKASPFVSGDFGVEAHLLLGGVAYAQGDLTKAQEHFFAAVEKDPRNSEAYSDLGLTMARQGKVADAEACFIRAEDLDFENTVAPGLGRVYLKFATADAAVRARAEFLAAAGKRKNKEEQLELAEQAATDAKTAIDEAVALVASGDDCLEANNPLNLLVRYFAGYALERQGDLVAAQEKYRAVIDNDHRYRMSIARLGVVLARFVEAEPEHARAEEFSKAADAHLTKAQALNPNDAGLAYLLARFHSVRGTQSAKANRMFAHAKMLPAPEGDRDLPLWAAAGAAALNYRDDGVEVGRVLSMFNNVVRNVRQMVTRDNPADLEQAVSENAVFQYCENCLAEIKENQTKRVVTYTFRTKPKSWSENKGENMMVGSLKGSLEFRGRINYGGSDPDPLAKNSASLLDKAVKSDTFHGVTFKGVIPDGTQVRVGMGVVKKKSRSRRGGSPYSGIQIQRNEITGNVDLRIDGARTVEMLKSNRNLRWIELAKVPWKTGPFEITIEVVDRKRGTFRILLKTGDGPKVNVIDAAWPGNGAETTRLLTRGGGGGAFEFFIWVDGSDGTEYKGIRIDEVKLVKSVK